MRRKWRTEVYRRYRKKCKKNAKTNAKRFYSKVHSGFEPNATRRANHPIKKGAPIEIAKEVAF